MLQLLVKLVEGTRWREKDKWQHPQTLPMLQVATSLHFGSWSPKKVGSEQVAQLMTTNPKRPRKSFKSTQCRELRLLRYFPGEESFRWNALQGIHWVKGKTVRKVFWEINCSNLVWYSLLSWENWLISSGLVLSLKTGTWLLLHLVPARETRASSGVLRSHCLSAL